MNKIRCDGLRLVALLSSAAWSAQGAVRGQAWLPNSVTVGMNSATGRVATCFSERKQVTNSLTQRLSAAQARAAATRATRLSGSLEPRSPYLRFASCGESSGSCG